MSERYREREKEAVVLESRLVKLEEGQLANRDRLDWIEKLIWGSIVGLAGLLVHIMVPTVLRVLRKDSKEI
jgi:hypothetical protein